MLTSYSRRPEPKAWEIVTCCVCTVYTLSTSTTSKQWHLWVAAVDAHKSSLSSSLDGLFCASADNIYFSTLVKVAALITEPSVSEPFSATMLDGMTEKCVCGWLHVFSNPRTLEPKMSHHVCLCAVSFDVVCGCVIATTLKTKKQKNISGVS